MIEVKDIYWLAGWLEGEGSFTIYEKESGYKQFRIEFSSTDLDTIEKVKFLSRSDQSIFLRKQAFSQLGNKKKPEYYMKIYGSLAIEWMMTLYKLMSTRRKAKIRDILTEWKSYIQNGSGLCRRCKRPLNIKITRTGWNRGKRYSWCNYCRNNKIA